jgi:hypothetical protein
MLHGIKQRAERATFRVARAQPKQTTRRERQ